MQKKRIVVAGAVLVAATVGAGGAALASSRVRQDSASERKSEAAYTEAHRADASVSAAEAEAAATAARPGRVFDTHLENEGHGLRWEVKTDDGSQVWEVQVDAHSGKVVSNQPDD